MNKIQIKSKARASLTVEAALVLPLFIYFFIALIYFIQIFTLQEHIQEAITKTGLSMAKTAYVYADFIDAEEARGCDDSSWEGVLDTGIGELALTALDGTAIKWLLTDELDTDLINCSCIQEGFLGISFYYSDILDESDNIDIIARYRIRLPVYFFGLCDMRMLQRVKLRGWTGITLTPRYTTVEDQDETGEQRVYITENGSVYHHSGSCSHIELSVREVYGKPTGYRNASGGKYYPCESCCPDNSPESAVYYITDYGTRFHINRSCGKIKRSVKQVPLSEAAGRRPCKRCSGNQ